jgi:hypothetical protein
MPAEIPATDGPDRILVLNEFLIYLAMAKTLIRRVRAAARTRIEFEPSKRTNPHFIC